MTNCIIVPKSSSFMIDDILRHTHAPQDEALTQDRSLTPNASPENLSHHEISWAAGVRTKPKARRPHPTHQQKKVLLETFSMQPNPSKEQLIQLAHYLDFTYEKVRRWFANRRKTERRQLKKLRELDDLASGLSSPSQPVIQAQALCSCSHHGYPTSNPFPYPNSTMCRNRGLVPRNSIGPVPVHRRVPQLRRADTEPKQELPVYKLTHGLHYTPLTQMIALPPSLLRPAVCRHKVPVVYRFQV